MIPNDLPLYPQINMSLNTHKRYFFFQQVIINTGTHTWQGAKRKRPRNSLS